MFQLKSTYTVPGHEKPYETSINFDTQAQAQAHIDKVVQLSKLTPSPKEPGTYDAYGDSMDFNGHYKFEIAPAEETEKESV